MLKLCSALMCILLLTGCQALGLISALSPASGGIEASAQVGEEANQQVIVGDQVKTEIDVEAETANVSHVRQDQATESNIETLQSYVVNNVAAAPMFIWILMILGWILPSPNEMWKGLLNFIKVARNK